MEGGEQREKEGEDRREYNNGGMEEIFYRINEWGGMEDNDERK